MSNQKTSRIERKAFISNIQKYNMYDGPGIRTLVFFKGCPLRCKWCSNPENLQSNSQVMCGSGSKCSVVGEAKTISELLETIEEDRMFYDISGGGVTLSGGEVLLQHDAAANLLMACKQVGINTAIETSGYAKLEHILQVAEFTDLFLFDIKHIESEKHYELTGVRNEQILKNLSELLHRRYQVKIRMPLLKGINDDDKEIEGVIRFLTPYKEYKNFKGIDLLPYHKMGVNKYKQLGWDYPLDKIPDPSLKEEDLSRIENMFKNHHFNVTVIRH